MVPGASPKAESLCGHREKSQEQHRKTQHASTEEGPHLESEATDFLGRREFPVLRGKQAEFGARMSWRRFLPCLGRAGRGGNELDEPPTWGSGKPGILLGR